MKQKNLILLLLGVFIFLLLVMLVIGINSKYPLSRINEDSKTVDFDNISDESQNQVDFYYTRSNTTKHDEGELVRYHNGDKEDISTIDKHYAVARNLERNGDNIMYRTDKDLIFNNSKLDLEGVYSYYIASSELVYFIEVEFSSDGSSVVSVSINKLNTTDKTTENIISNLYPDLEAVFARVAVITGLVNDQLVITPIVEGEYTPPKLFLLNLNSKEIIFVEDDRDRAYIRENEVVGSDIVFISAISTPINTFPGFAHSKYCLNLYSVSDGKYTELYCSDESLTNLVVNTQTVAFKEGKELKVLQRGSNEVTSTNLKDDESARYTLGNVFSTDKIIFTKEHLVADSFSNLVTENTELIEYITSSESSMILDEAKYLYLTGE